MLEELFGAPKPLARCDSGMPQALKILKRSGCSVQLEHSENTLDRRQQIEYGSMEPCDQNKKNYATLEK